MVTTIMINLWNLAHFPSQIFVMGVMSMNNPFTNHTEQQNIRSANKNHHANMVAIPSNLFFNSPYGHGSGISSLAHNTTQNKVPAQLFVPFTFIPFVKKDAKKHALKFIDTEYGLTIEPCLSSMNNNQKKIETLEKAILRIRQDIIDTSKNVFADEVKKRCTFWCENYPELANHAIIVQGNSCNIFDWFSEIYDDNWGKFMQVTSTIFLSPMVLHKSWIFELKSQVESKYNFVIVKIDSFDSPRCADFVRMISHKNIKNMVEKWYSKNLNKFGLKLLTKKPKMENEMFVQSIVVNHPTFDTNFTTSCIYIVKTKGETLSEPGGLNDDYIT